MSIRSAAIGLSLLAAMPARADSNADLIGLINAYRAAPGECAGRQARPAPPLAPSKALSAIRIGTGTILQAALEDAGYVSRRAEAITVSGPSDPREVMELIERRYCASLLSPQFTEAGVRRDGGEWQLVLAQPIPKVVLPDWPVAGRTMLGAVNAARAVARSCGEEDFPPAPALSWNQALGEAAQAHSRVMARTKRLTHQEPDGSQVGERASRAGYRWLRIGENIASGQPTPEEAVASWLTSPGHCANIMSAGFTEMGAGYAINPDKRLGTVYWTQVFGMPR
ncbi:CAP domain-containing protein [Massilia cavernae]|uniref:CAP domain-containing protein n=1 Tax=Massilia cavernae TaxID=2320864 RepID=A0A418XSI8_9BURK|nr:CAP domain-containing protein [Massilia cavernae]RJG15542.1 CAP domain-containing protein [Massilia cavernae]